MYVHKSCQSVDGGHLLGVFETQGHFPFLNERVLSHTAEKMKLTSKIFFFLFCSSAFQFLG